MIDIDSDTDVYQCIALRFHVAKTACMGDGGSVCFAVLRQCISSDQ